MKSFHLNRKVKKGVIITVNRCVCCGEIIPEGRMVCPVCESKTMRRKTQYKNGRLRRLLLRLLKGGGGSGKR